MILLTSLSEREGRNGIQLNQVLGLTLLAPDFLSKINKKNGGCSNHPSTEPCKDCGDYNTL